MKFIMLPFQSLWIFSTIQRDLCPWLLNTKERERHLSVRYFLLNSPGVHACGLERRETIISDPPAAAFGGGGGIGTEKGYLGFFFRRREHLGYRKETKWIRYRLLLLDLNNPGRTALRLSYPSYLSAGKGDSYHDHYSTNCEGR